MSTLPSAPKASAMMFWGSLEAKVLEWLPCPPPGDLPNPRISPTSLMSPALAGRFFTTGATWKAMEGLPNWSLSQHPNVVSCLLTCWLSVSSIDYIGRCRESSFCSAHHSLYTQDIEFQYIPFKWNKLNHRVEETPKSPSVSSQFPPHLS